MKAVVQGMADLESFLQSLLEAAGAAEQAAAAPPPLHPRAAARRRSTTAVDVSGYVLALLLDV